MSLLHVAFGASLLVLPASAAGQTDAALPPPTPTVARAVPAHPPPTSPRDVFEVRPVGPRMAAVPRPLADVDQAPPKQLTYVCDMPVIRVNGGLDPRILAPFSDEARQARIRIIKPSGRR